MAIPAVTHVYTPDSCCNSRNRMRHSPRWEMRLDSNALHAHQSCIPNQICKDPQFSGWNTRESPGTLSQNEMNTDAPQEFKIARCTPNQLDKAHFPFIGSIAMPCSTEYSRSGLTSLRNLQRFSETSASSLYEYSFQHSSSKKVPCTRNRLKM